MRAINRFLLEHEIRIAGNPCVSPDFCLDWPSLQPKLSRWRPPKEWSKSGFETAAGNWTLVEDEVTGDCAWKFTASRQGKASDALADGTVISRRRSVRFLRAGRTCFA